MSKLVVDKCSCGYAQAALAAMQHRVHKASGISPQSIQSPAPGFREYCGIVHLPRKVCWTRILV